MDFIKVHSKTLTVLFVVIVLQGVVCFVTIFRPTGSIITAAAHVYDDVSQLKKYGTERDITTVPLVLASLRENTSQMLLSVDQMKVLNYMPMVRPLYRDLPTISKIIDEALRVHQDLIKDLVPFASVLGLDSQDVEGQYLENFLKASPQVIPVLDSYLTDIEPVLSYLLDLSVETYPNTGVPIRDIATNAIKTVQAVSENLPQIKELVIKLPDLMGVDSTKRYLVLFQNDKEIRPTGGFITSFTILNSKAGEINFSEAKNIYEIRDDQVYYAPPDPILRYLTEKAWHMRDTNFSPDYKESMDMFSTYWQQVGQPPVDGIIAIDTQLVAALLEYTGDIKIKDYAIDFSLFPHVPDSCKDGGATFTSENVVCRLEFYSSQLTSDQSTRKDVLGALMNGMYDQIMASNSTQWYPLATTAIKQLNEKHALLYFIDPQLQDLAETYNFAGRIVPSENDYVHVNDANLAGLKSDMYLVRSVDHKYSLSAEGVIIKTVTLTYENTGTFDGWLNATARNYVRLYVPKGSKLLETVGGEAVTSVATDLGKTVFDNFLLIPPMSTSSVQFTYTIPQQKSNSLLLDIQKQPGKGAVVHTIFVNGELRESFEVTTDTTREVTW